MKIIESLEKRRSYYSIGKELPVSEAQVTCLLYTSPSPRDS